MILNLLFVICCVPVVTIGPALTALHYVAFKMRTDDEGSIPRSFFRSFLQNFRQGFLLELILAPVGALLFFDLRTVWLYPSGTGIRVAVTAAALIYLMTLLHVFALLARFNNTVFGTIRNALWMSIISLPRTLSMLMLVAACVMVTMINAQTIKFGILAWLLLGFACVVYFNTFLLEKNFRKVTGSAEAAGAGDAEDAEAAADAMDAMDAVNPADAEDVQQA